MSVISNSPESEGGSWLPVPLPDAANVTDISGMLAFFDRPLRGLGTAVHVEFSAINFRRHKTHDVKVTKTDNMPSTSGGLSLDANQMGIITTLSPEELSKTPPMLRKFFNQLEITDTDEVRGFFILHYYSRDISDPNFNTHDVGFLLNESEIEKGRFGLTFRARGVVELIPDRTRPWGNLKMPPEEYRSEVEKKADEAFYRLSGGLRNPFIARAYLEATLLVGNAILARKIKSEYFK